jgi:3-hydroxymyristoyl/3-hydroxydecanoyl-(acyl carrier protein) dehydratase
MSTILDSAAIGERLGFAPAWQMLDRAICDEDGAWRGLKLITMGDPVFCGHFPQLPILPGVLQLEAMYQLAILAARDAGATGFPYLAVLGRTKFKSPVSPGDRMLISVTAQSAEDNSYSYKARSEVAGSLATQSSLTLRFVDAPFSEIAEFAPDLVMPEGGEVDALGMMAAIPHRYPFLLVDRLLGYQGENHDTSAEITGLKNVSASEPCSLAHFQGRPFLPPTLIAEIVAQIGCACKLIHPEHSGKMAFFTGVSATFDRLVVPGDQLRVVGRIVRFKAGFGQGAGDVFVGTEKVARAEISFALRDA